MPAAEGTTARSPKKKPVRFRDLPKKEQSRRITAAENAGRLTHQKAEDARNFHGLAPKPTKAEKKFDTQLGQAWAGSVGVAKPGAAAPTRETNKPPRYKGPKDVPLKDFASFARPSTRGAPSKRVGMEVARAANWAKRSSFDKTAQEMLARTRGHGLAQQVRDIRTGIPEDISFGRAAAWARKHPGSQPSFTDRIKRLDPRDVSRGDLEDFGRGALDSLDPRNLPGQFTRGRGAVARGLGIPEEGEGNWGLDLGGNLRALDDLAGAAPAVGKALGEGFAGFGRDVATALSPSGFAAKPGRFGGSFQTSTEPVEAERRVGRTVSENVIGESLTKALGRAAKGQGFIPEGKGGKLLLGADVALSGIPILKPLKGAKAIVLAAEQAANATTAAGRLDAARLTWHYAMGTAPSTKRAVAKMTALAPPSRERLHAEIDALHAGDPETAQHLKDQIDAGIYRKMRKPPKKGDPIPAASKQAKTAEKAYADTANGIETTKADIKKARDAAEERGRRDAATGDAPQPKETGLAPEALDFDTVTKGVDMSVFRQHGVESLIENLPRLLERGRGGRYWYEQSAKMIRAFAGQDKELAAKYAQVVAIMSAQRNPFTNIELATEALRAIQRGDVVRVGTKEQRFKVAQVMADIPWDGRKTDRFYKNLIEDIDYQRYLDDFHGGEAPLKGEVTNDIWHARLFGIKTKVPTEREYAAMEQVTRNIGEALGWKGKQIQAALWGPIRSEGALTKGTSMTDLEGMQDFSHALLRESARLPYEPAPGKLTAGQASYDAYHALSPEAKQAFDDEVNTAVEKFLRDSGALAILRGRGMGLYELQTNPVYLALMPMAMTGKGVMGPASKEAVDAVATMIGEALKQDATAWFRPKYMKTVPPGKQNGAKITGLGRELTQDEILGLNRLLEQKIGKGAMIGIPPEPEGGFYILNHTPDKVMKGKKLTNAKFQQFVDEALAEALPPEAGVTKDHLYFQGAYHQRPPGGYEQVNADWGKRPAAQRAFADLKKAVNDTHQRHLGLDGPSDPPRRLKGWEQPGDPGVLHGRTTAPARAGPQEFNVAEEAMEPGAGMRDVSEADPLAPLRERVSGLTGTERQNLRAKITRYENLLFKGDHTPAEMGRMYRMEVSLGIEGPARQRVRSGMSGPLTEAEMGRVLKSSKKGPRSAAQRAALDPAKEQLSFLEPGSVTPAPEIQGDDVMSQMLETLRVFGETGEVPTTKKPLTAAGKIGTYEEEDAGTEALLRAMGGENDAKAVDDAIKAAEKAQKMSEPKKGKKPRPGQEALDLEEKAAKKAAKDPTRTASGRLRGKPTRMRAAARELDQIDDFDLDREALEVIAQKHKLNADELRDYIEKQRIKGIEPTPERPAVSRAKPKKAPRGRTGAPRSFKEATAKGKTPPARKPRGRSDSREPGKPRAHVVRAEGPGELVIGKPRSVVVRAEGPAERIIGKPVSARARSITRSAQAQRRKPGATILKTHKPSAKAVRRQKAGVTRARPRKTTTPTTRMVPRMETAGRSAGSVAVPRKPQIDSPVARSYIEKMNLGWKQHKNIDDDALKDLFDTIRLNDNLTVEEKQQALGGLYDALAGRMAINKPGQRALKKAFGEDGDYIVKRLRDSQGIIAHAKRMGYELWQLPRAGLTVLDLSAAGVQGMMAMASHPVLWWKNFTKMHRAFGTKAMADQMNFAVESDPLYPRASRTPLGIERGNQVDPKTGRTVGSRYEQLAGGTYIERIPTVAGGGLVRGSIRSYEVFLNKLRFDIWKDLVTKYEKSGRYEAAEKRALKGMENASPERRAASVREAHQLLDDQVASLANGSTGYGTFGRAEGTILIRGMTELFFSPRYLVARLNTINPYRYAPELFGGPRLDNRVRLARFRQAAQTSVLLGSTLYLLDQIDGVDAVYDPYSKDFGKVRFGNSETDIAAGLGGHVALTLQVIMGKYRDSKGKMHKVGEFGGDTRLDLIENWGKNKAAPVPGYIVQALDQQQGGRDFNAMKEALNSVLPIMGQDTYDIVREHGWEGLGLAIPALYGKSTNISKPPEDKTPRIVPGSGPFSGRPE